MLGDSEVTDIKLIANGFNNHFINISENLTSTIPETNNNAMSFMPSKLLDSFFIDPVTTTEIDEKNRSFKSV